MNNPIEDNEEAFEAFNTYRHLLDYDLEDQLPDWELWWDCFLAGWRSCIEILGC